MVLHSGAPDMSQSVPQTAAQPTIVNNGNTIHATKTIDIMGKQLLLSVDIAKEKGPITGSISGDCRGILTGTNSGTPDYTLDGKGNVTCPLGVITINAVMTFTGKLHPDQKNADINYTITAQNGMTKSGSVTVSYSE